MEIGHRVWRRAPLPVAALAAAALVSACGGSSSSPESSSSGSATGKKLDVARVELSIEQSVLSEKHLVAHVTCPASVEQRTGNTFTCYATGTVGTGAHKAAFRTPFTVEQVNDKGGVYYHS
jgi:Domain of unknown function (DUF4333)